MSEFLNLDRESKAQKQLQKRSVFLFFLVSVFGIVTLFQLVKLTILDSTLYTTLSDENRIIRVPIYPSRGVIKLSNDEIVTENIVSQALTMLPAKTQDIEKTLSELRADLFIDDKQLLALKERIINKPSSYETNYDIEHETEKLLDRITAVKRSREKVPSERAETKVRPKGVEEGEAQG